MSKTEIEYLIALLPKIEAVESESVLFKITREKTCKLVIDFRDGDMHCDPLTDYFMSALTAQLTPIIMEGFKEKAIAHIKQKIVDGCEEFQTESEDEVNYAKAKIKEYK